MSVSLEERDPFHPLCLDVWIVIFEADIGSEDCSYFVRPLLLVCKAWRTFAMPLFYRHLHFPRTEMMTRFLVHILFHDLARAESCVDWICSVYITDVWLRSCDDDLRPEASLTLFFTLPNLRFVRTPLTLDLIEVNVLVQDASPCSRWKYELVFRA